MLARPSLASGGATRWVSSRSLQRPAPLTAPRSVLLPASHTEQFPCESDAGVLCLLPLIRHFGIDRAIGQVGFPGSSQLPALQSVLAFVALKCASIRRYSCDDRWCRDRGPGLFAGLNVLPETAWTSSCSDRITRSLHQDLLDALAELRTQHQLVSESAHLDGTTQPHWGDDRTLQQPGPGTRHRSLLGCRRPSPQIRTAA